MSLPALLIQSLKDVKGFHQSAFEEVHALMEPLTSIRLNPSKPVLPAPVAWALQSPVPWCTNGYYLASRPSFTFDPLFHAGCYYVQEASSMFLEQALKQAANLSQPLRVLDLCAAPGGKSTHIQSLLSKQSLLVSNEVIRSRANILKDNIIKWGAENVVVTHNDPRDFARLENYFDVIVADAPCSGSGLFRREPEAISEWSEANVTLCSQRQQRILADVLPALTPGGILVYSTCSYSAEENEMIVKWLTENFSLEIVPLNINDEWNIIESGGGYRFWPDKVRGEGFFMAVCRKKGNNEQAPAKRRSRISEAGKAELEMIAKWVETAGRRFVKKEDTVYAWPALHFDEFAFLLQQLKVVYAGVLTGELLRDKLVPDHALAMSRITAAGIQREELDYTAAVKFLQRKETGAVFHQKGWTLASYNGHALGWMNVLPGRVNNYYPKELRILKESPDQ